MIKGKAFYVFWYISALILPFTMLPKPISAQGDAMIIPGVGVGVLKLGEHVDDILKKIGHSDVQQWRTTQVQIEKKIVKMMWLSLEELGMSLGFDYDNKKLEKILVSTKALLVQNTSLRIGMAEKEVKKFLGPPQISESREFIDYPQLGVKFYIDLNDHTVRTIEVYEKATKKIRIP